MSLAEKIPEHFYTAVFKNEKRNVQVGAAVRWHGDWVLTCAHVVDAAFRGLGTDNSIKPEGATIYLAVGKAAQIPVTATVKYYSGPTELDVAILTISRIETSGTYLPELDGLGFPEQFSAVDFTQKPEFNIYGRYDRNKNRGVWVTGKVANTDGSGQVQLDCDKNGVEPGYSGGPVFDASYQKLYGIVSARDESKLVAYMIPGSHLMDALNSISPAQPKSLVGVKPQKPDAELTARGRALSAVFLDRKNLIESIKHLPEKIDSTVVPIILKCNDNDWPDGAALRLVFDSVRFDGHQVPVTADPIGINWPRKGKLNDVLTEIRQTTLNKLKDPNAVNDKSLVAEIFSAEDWAKQAERYLKQLFINDIDRKIVLHYKVPLGTVDHCNVNIISDIVNDWFHVRRASGLGEYILVFSFVDETLTGKVSIIEKYWPFRRKYLCDQVATQSLTQWLMDNSGTSSIKLEQQDILVPLEFVTAADLPIWQQDLQQRFGLSESKAILLRQIVEEALPEPGLAAFKIYNLVSAGKKVQDALTN